MYIRQSQFLSNSNTKNVENEKPRLQTISIGNGELHPFVHSFPFDPHQLLFLYKASRKERSSMTLQECYDMLGGNLDQVKKRLPSIHLIQKFIAQFLDDRSFSALCEAMRAGKREEAFRAAHTLKGICATLSFDRLFSEVEPLTELLRPKTEIIPPDAFCRLEDVKKSYALTADAIRAYLSSKQELA